MNQPSSRPGSRTAPPPAGQRTPTPAPGCLTTGQTTLSSPDSTIDLGDNKHVLPAVTYLETGTLGGDRCDFDADLGVMLLAEG